MIKSGKKGSSSLLFTLGIPILVMTLMLFIPVVMFYQFNVWKKII